MSPAEPAHWSWDTDGWVVGPTPAETAACPICGRERCLTMPADRRQPRRRVCPQCSGGRG